MEAVITKKTELDIENIEYRDIRELVEGFNAAMVNYALSENGKIIKVVTFFNTKAPQKRLTFGVSFKMLELFFNTI